ncbi:hypothetical protein [Salsuginibacillus kocurii]|uniref:hypothetical protein n=1 Tax=Salsuginibacillus kocurii TaxID=427078 RepID=UPI0003652809|nr:hypothetical protein [Salsuginibacillus kocurii]
MTIQHAAPADADLVLKLLAYNNWASRKQSPPPKESFEPSSLLEQELRSSTSQALIYYVPAGPAGAVQFTEKKDHIEFYKLSVVIEYRGHKIEQELIGYLEGMAKEKGNNYICCRVQSDECMNHLDYEALNYQRNRHYYFKNSGDGPVDIYYMYKEL